MSKAVSTPTNTETPRAPSSPSTPASPDEKYAGMAQETLSSEIKRMKEVLLDMKAAAARQSNMSTVVKNGLVTLEASVGVIESMQKLWSISAKRLRESASKATQAPSPPMAPLSYATVTESGAKRQATSPPLDNREEKRQRESGDTGDDFQPALSKSQRRKERAKARKERAPSVQTKPKTPRGPRQRPDAILVKPLSGKTYADVLGEIRRNAKPEEKGTIIKALRKTKTGDLLVELGQSDPGAQSHGEFQKDLQSVLGNSATVRVLEPKATLEVRDLDVRTT